MYDLQFMDKIVEVVAHDSEILSVQYSPVHPSCKIPPLSLPPSLPLSLFYSTIGFLNNNDSEIVLHVFLYKDTCTCVHVHSYRSLVFKYDL